LPDQDPIPKGLSIRIGESQQAAVCYDTQKLDLRAAWTGAFLKFSAARFGLNAAPEIAGEILFAGLSSPSGTEDLVQYQGLWRNGTRTVLQYRIGKTEILESPWLLERNGQLAISRSFERSPSAETISIPVMTGKGKPAFKQVNGVELAIFVAKDHCVALAGMGIPGSRWELGEKQNVSWKLPSTESVQRGRLLYWSGPLAQLDEFTALIQSAPAPESVSALKKAGPSLWTKTIETRGQRGGDDGPYVVDTLTLPFKNPYRALMFASGHDFFSNGDIALSTAHGDLWRISGVNDSLEKLVWKRYATGLYQPLGVKIIDDVVHVLCRDEIVRLHDLNGDQEADWYECFYNGYETSTHPHDYATCLETDSHGDFYFAHAVLGVVRVKKDGSGHDVVATGLRNPNGLSVGPDDTITAAPQEGTWTPASAVFEVRPGQHYGYRGPQVTPQRPLGYDPPICWMPKQIDSSTGGQVWVTSDRWGPLEGQLFNLSYGKCQMMLVVREHIDDVPQGGSIVFPLTFDSGIMRGRFHPGDGQMYLSGLRGWVTSAVLDGCLQRVRYTGQPVNVPVQVRTMKNGLAITYTRPLDPASVDAGSFQIQQWNYRYSSSYGSADYRVSGKLKEGRDNVPVQSATLLKDGRTVFVEIHDLKPVMQMSLAGSLKDTDGNAFRQTIYYTINNVGEEAIDPSLLVHKMSPGQLPAEVEEQLKPGLAIKFIQGKQQRTTLARMAALEVSHQVPPAIGLQPGPFQAIATGYFKAPLRGEYALRLTGTGTARLRINGASALPTIGDLSQTPSVKVLLHGGYNEFELEYTSPPEGTASLQVLWRGQDFPEEPLSPALFWHDQRTPGLAETLTLQSGRELFANHRCFRCHQFSFDAQSPALMPELLSDAPDLRKAGERLNRNWIVEWLLAPGKMRNQTTMPQLFDASHPEQIQEAADIAAFLIEGMSAPSSRPHSPAAGSVKKGESVYATQGCFTCHRLSPPDEEDDFARMSLHAVGQKYTASALRDYLLEPQSHDRFNRMPDFHLSNSEATQLTDYLLANGMGETELFPKRPAGDPVRGKFAFVERGCVRCHHQSTELVQMDAKPLLPLRAVSNGCLSETPAENGRVPRFSVPRYGFDEAQRAALLAYLRSDPESLTLEPPAASSLRLFTSLRCGACHPRDDRPSPRAAIYVEEFDTGFFPEAVPSLTWAGEKLYSQWIDDFLSGRITYKPRTSLKSRMPAFPAYAHVMAQGLAAEHGHPPGAAVHRFDQKLAKIGNELSLKNTGLDCRQCHGVGSDQPVGDRNTLLAVGVNFAYIRDRLRPEFYQRFVLDPPRFDINTKMPKLALDGRTTKITAYYDGNAAEQFNALWNFIQSVQPPVSSKK